MNKQKAKQIIKKTKDDYNRIAPQFDSTRKYNWSDIAKVINSLDIPKGSKVLDLGCGGGRLYELLLKYDVDYTGIDISDELIKTARKKYPDAKFEVGDATDFKAECKYDYVFSVAVLHHIPSKELRTQTIENIINSLAKNGTAVVSVWYFWNQPKYLKEILKQFFSPKLSFKDFYIPWKDQSGKILASRYHHAWTAGELKKEGFKIISKDRNLIGIYKSKSK